MCACVCDPPPTCLACPQELGTLLNVAPHKAEALAADMIGEGRLSGRIDQVRGDTQTALPASPDKQLPEQRCVCVCEDQHVVTGV